VIKPYADRTEVMRVPNADALNSLFLGDEQLVRISTSPRSASTGGYWTTLRSITDNDGNLLAASEISSRLGIGLPQEGEQYYISTNGIISAGATVDVGVTAQTKYGTGGGIQIISDRGNIVGTTGIPLGSYGK